MTLLSAAYYGSFLVSAWLCFYILSKNPKEAANRICALLILCFTVRNLTSLLIQNSSSYSEAVLWLNISSLGWCGFAGFAILLSYVLTFGKKNGGRSLKWYYYPVIFIFPAFFIYQQWSGRLISGLMRSNYGWVPVWSASIWTRLFFAYYISFTLAAMGLLVISYKNKSFNEKKQIKVIIFSASIFLIGGTLTQILLSHNIPPIGTVFSVIFSAGVVYSIARYNFLTLTPAYAAPEIISTMNDFLILIDSESRVIEVNSALLKLLGYSRPEFIGSPVEKLLPWPASPGAADFRDKRIVLRTKTGEGIPVSFSSSSMKDRNGNYIGIVGVARDMREILRLQERERELAAEKARTGALQGRARELHEAYDRLREVQIQLVQSEKMAAVGRLAGGVAHEINNPLGVILGFAQSVIKGIGEDDPLYMPLKSIEREAIRCRKLILDLLAFSRTENTRDAEIDMNQTIEDTLSFVKASAKVKNIDIIKEFDRALPRIIISKNMVQQLIVNLCNNAIDAMPGGGKIVITTLPAGKSIELRISDSRRGPVFSIILPTGQ